MPPARGSSRDARYASWGDGHRDLLPPGRSAVLLLSVLQDSRLRLSSCTKNAPLAPALPGPRSPLPLARQAAALRASAAHAKLHPARRGLGALGWVGGRLQAQAGWERDAVGRGCCCYCSS